ncbi:EamA family transporter, partial [Candidatus Peregrinibacteria bacterium]|nr:EamA family transporter [Candidatus Peregrinibacteria bacterium]
GRQLVTGIKIEKISLKRFKKLTLISLLATIGTGAFALAVQDGAIGVVSAIAAAGTIFVTTASHFYHHEKLNLKQLIGIGAVVLGIIGLKLFE